MRVVLSVKQLTKIFDVRGFFYNRSKEPFIAIDRISFDLHEGEILGFLGPNGAGKTTTIQMLLGLMTPTSGSITYFGKDFFLHRSQVLQQVTFASAYTSLTSRLTIYENLDFFGMLYGLEKSKRVKRIEQYLKFFDLWDIRDRLTGVLSAGQATKVMLIKAFLPDPRIVLLDEPTASLDPDVATLVRQFIIKQKQERSVSVLFTSHNMTEVEELCDRLLILKRGNIVANNTPQEIANQIFKTRIHLMIPDELLARTEEFLRKQNFIFKIEKPFVEIEIDEEKIADLLVKCAENKIRYTQIYIDRPTLEDYFLQIAKQG